MMRSGRDLGDCWAEKRTDNKECRKDGALCNDRWRREGALRTVIGGWADWVNNN